MPRVHTTLPAARAPAPGSDRRAGVPQYGHHAPLKVPPQRAHRTAANATGPAGGCGGGGGGGGGRTAARSRPATASNPHRGQDGPSKGEPHDGHSMTPLTEAGDI